MTHHKKKNHGEPELNGTTASDSTQGPALAESAADKLREAKDTVQATLQDVSGAAAGKLHDVTGATAEKLQRLEDVTSEKLHEYGDRAVERLREAKDFAAESAHEAMESVSETFEDVRDGAVRAGGASLRFVQRNALPLAFLGAGVAWLVWNNQREPGSQRPRTGGRSGKAGAQGRAQESGGRLGEVRGKANQLYSRANERAHQWAERAEEVVRDGGGRARHLVEEEYEHVREFADANPLALGAAALAAGLGIGLLLPATERENELLGETRDKLIDGAREKVEELGQAAKDMGMSVKESAQDLKQSLGMGAEPRPH